MENFQDLEKIYSELNQKKGLINLKHKFKKYSFLNSILTDLQNYTFGKSIDKIFNKSSIEKKEDFFNKIFTFLRIFIPESKFCYYFYDENSNSYDLFYTEIEDYMIISSIEEAIDEGIIN